MNIAPNLRWVRNHFYNRLMKPSVKIPTYAYITIETVCNSRCGYCDMWKTKKGDQPTTEEWKTIIDDIRDLGVVTLTFSGGEPFINKDLFELAAYAKSRGLMTMVVSNLSLFNDSHIEKISESFDFFGTSIDSTKPEIYKEIRGVDWLERNKQNIKKITDGLAELKSSTAVCAMVTVSNRNAHEIHEVLHMVFDELNMDTISFNLIDTQGGENAGNFAPMEHQIDIYRKIILDHKSIYPIMNSTRYISQFGNFDYKCNPYKCIQINHEGTLISPCLFIKGRNFNLREQKLSDVWKAKSTQEIYNNFSQCRKCNLGCVAEAAWSTYDLNFMFNDVLRGMMLPTLKRVKNRNSKKTRKAECNLEYPRIENKRQEPVIKVVN